VDKHDNDNTVTGIGDGATRDANDTVDRTLGTDTNNNNR
jgi:hypothetical protein